MPSTSKAQAHLMAAVAHGWEPPGKHIPKSVGEEFHAADKKQGKWEHPRGSGGKMEKLKGRAHTSAERSHKHRHGKGGRY